MARFILSRSKVLSQYSSIEDIGIVSYSFKTNPLVGKVLEENTDCFFSVHFINELELIKNKSRVWFIAQALSNELLDRLFNLGVDKFVIENQEDLNLLLQYIENNDLSIELLLRMKLKENTIRTEKHYVFGIESDVVNKKIIELKKNSRIRKIGVHAHRKTQNVSEWDLKREFSELLCNEVLEAIDYLDVGGGIPVMYKNISDKIMPVVIEKLKEASNWLSEKKIKMIIEPGRYISGPAVILETEIVGIHSSTIVVDASVYNSSPDTLIVPIKLLVEGEVSDETDKNRLDDNNKRDAKQYIIKGITPCSADIFRYRVYFPEGKELKIGGKIMFLNAGAYNFHTEFCELGKIKTDVVE